MNKEIKRVAVYCSSCNKIDDIYKSETKKLGEALASKGINLVFGAGNLGLMGIISETMYKLGSEVIGITLENFSKVEGENPNTSKTIIAPSLFERKYEMNNQADAIIGVPGGFGTIDEITEVIALKQIGMFDKPIILFNIDGFWDSFIKLCEEIIEKKFATEEHVKMFTVANTVEEVIQALEEPKSLNPSDHNWRV